MIAEATFIGATGHDWLLLGLGAVVSLIITLVIIYFQRRPKAFGWVLLSDANLIVKDHQGIGSQLEVAWNGDRVTAPRVVEVSLKNVGKEEILASDFDQPVRVHFPNARILEVGQSGASDQAMGGQSFALTSPDTVTVTPVLFNEGDWFDLLLIMDGGDGGPEVTTRIAGQSRPVRQYEDNEFAATTSRLALEILRRSLGGAVSLGVGRLP